MKPYRIPPLVTDIVQTALSSLDGMEFTKITSCPLCGGVLQGYDKKTKKFVVLREKTGDRVITVRVKRFYCRKCGTLCNADEPFYPGSRIGSPVIDLFFSFSATMPPSRAARVIDALGIIVNRTTWRNYIGRPHADIPAMDVFGIRIPLCIMKLSDIAIKSGESGYADPVNVIAVCNSKKAKAGSTGEIA